MGRKAAGVRGTSDPPRVRTIMLGMSLFWLALIALTASWLTRLGTLAGRGISGAAAEALGWVCLYGLLGSMYHRTGAAAARPDFRWGRVGLGLGLTLLSVQLARSALAPVLMPAGWQEYYYLRFLLPFVFVAFWLAALLPTQTATLATWLMQRRSVSPLPQLLVLLVVAALAVSMADLAFQWTGGSAAELALKAQVIEKIPWATNVAILFSALALIFALTERVTVALLLGLPPYGMLALATILKLRYMHAAVQPLDLLRLPELLPFLQGFLGTPAIAAMALALVVWVAALLAVRSRPRVSVPSLRRWSIGVLAALVLIMFPEEFLRVKHSSHSPLLRLIWGWNKGPGRAWREKARSQGFLLAFLAELPTAFVSVPSPYYPSAVADVLRRYAGAGSGSSSSRRPGVNLIVYLVESLMDPDDLGYRYTEDPVPEIRGLRQRYTSGHAFVPEEFGGSANTEFELLTGMSVSFLPKWSLPYRQYVRRSLPALPSVLKSLGYATTAIQADPKYFYNREEAYPLLGFDRVIWLDNIPGVERAVRGQSPSDQAVVASIIQASQARRPFFIFAFPTSTHSPYTQRTYASSRLDVRNPPEDDPTGEVKEYINALRVADRAVGTLIDYFRHQPDSTMIVVLGDHLPPISSTGFRRFFANLSRIPAAEQARFHRRVPLLVWSNFDRTKDTLEVGTNVLAAHLLTHMGISPPGFFAVCAALGRRIPVLPGAGPPDADIEPWNPDTISGPVRGIVNDYRLLQYDLLLGKQYSLTRPASTPASNEGRAAAGAGKASAPPPAHR